MGQDNYCRICGYRLTKKQDMEKKEVPYCECCRTFRYPMSNLGMSAIVYDPTGSKIALIQQYGKKDHRLIAGYANHGERIEETVRREIMEELGLQVMDMRFNASHFFEPSNTMMMNFACRVNSDDLTHTNHEVDSAAWFSPEEAEQALLDHAKESNLASWFLHEWLHKNCKY